MQPSIMQLLQTSLTIAMCAAGALIVVAGNRQQARVRDITRIPIISPRGKHVIGILLILIGIVIFLSQFIVRK